MTFPVSSPSPNAESDSESLANHAARHVETLAGSIGPRPAGSSAEQQAFDYVAGQLNAWGYQLERSPAAFAPLPAVDPIYLLGGLALAVAGWLIPIAARIVVFLPFFFMAIPELSRWVLRRRKPSLESQNLYALPKMETPLAPALILSAHVDSAPVVPFHSPLLLRLYSRSLDVLQRISIAIAAFAFLRVFGFAPSDWLIRLLAVLGSLGGAWLILVELLPLLNKTRPYSPGANDNASGVGVCLALAEYLAAHPVQGTSVGFLFTGAEETGMHGAQSFAGAHQHLRHQTPIVCLDMVGSGEQLGYVAKLGLFRPKFTDKELNMTLAHTNPALQPLWYTLRSGDFEAFLRAGFKTTAIQTTGNKSNDVAYHTVYDTIEIINERSIGLVLSTLLHIIGSSTN